MRKTRIVIAITLLIIQALLIGAGLWLLSDPETNYPIVDVFIIVCNSAGGALNVCMLRRLIKTNTDDLY